MHACFNTLIRYKSSAYATENKSLLQFRGTPIFLVLVLVTVWLTAGCSKDSDQTAQNNGSLATDTVAASAAVNNPRLWEDPRYKDWTSTTAGIVKLYYPASHQHAAEMTDMAHGYQYAVTTIMQRLERPTTLDTVRIYMYTGPGQGKAMTGHDAPFADAAGIHYWPNYLRGESLVKYLLPLMYGTEAKYPIVKHGLSALFDFAGEDYHRVTLGYTRDTMFIPLSQLAMDTAMNSTYERHQSGEAASFLAFVLGEYGADAVSALYQSTVSFDSAVTRIFGITTDSLQQQWISYVHMVVPDSGQVTP